MVSFPEHNKVPSTDSFTRVDSGALIKKLSGLSQIFFRKVQNVVEITTRGSISIPNPYIPENPPHLLSSVLKDDLKNSVKFALDADIVNIGLAEYAKGPHLTSRRVSAGYRLISLWKMFNYYEKGNDERNFKRIKTTT